ncbi:hypothetical protein VTN00DRAFT_1111 [Thermoascus crustaceus]|uniref:uncharacterized protein n=1 Tax=Thermoascus crustaceus TaxID=5088 RepID=UPI00374412BA
MSKRIRSDSLSSLSDHSPETPSVSSPASSTPPPPRAKVPQLDTSDSDLTTEVMRCSLPPHKETFSFPSYEEYEVHYMQAHVNRCSECGKNFPTDLFLNLHIEENHDPLIAARRERGEKTYGCFVEGCERKCSTPQKRRRHLIDKHMFPRTYNFFIVNDGIDKHTSLLRSPNNHRRRVSTPSSPQEGRLRRRKASLTSYAPSRGVPDHHSRHQTAAVPSETDMADLEKSMAALRFVPASVARNREGRRAGPV